MAIIGKIRSKSGLVVGFVALALILFVLSDFLSNRNSGPDSQVAGEVFGEEIDLMEYEREVQAQTDMAKQNNPEFNDDMGDRIREEVWNQMVNRKIFERELEGFNFTITGAELNDLIFGDNIQDYVKNTPYFKNQFTGEFSLDSVKSFRRRVDGSPEGKNWWVSNIEQPVKDNRRITKYFNLITKGMYVTNAEVARDYTDNYRKFKVRFVVSPFTAIADSTIKVSDDEIREYYNKNKHRKKFEQVGSRRFSWVEFLLAPSQDDIDFAKRQAESYYDQFKESKNDSSFVMTFAETKQFSNEYSQAGTYPADIDSLVQKADSGSIIGPFRNGETWQIIKVRAVKTETEANARHILFPIVNNDEKAARAKADSVLKVIRKNDNFGEMAAQFGTDGTKDKGGDLGWFTKGAMVPEFENAVFNGKVKQLQIVKTQFGIHIMEVTDRREAKRVKTAMVDVSIRPMKETDMAVREKAVEFLGNLKDATQFQKTAQNMKLNVQEREISYNQKSVDGTPGGRTVASWVLRANEGDVSEPTIFNDKYVVIKLDNIKEKGMPEFDDVKDIMRFEVVREKKGEMEAKKMAGAKSLEEIATKLKLTVEEAELSFASSVIPTSTGNNGASGTEYAVIGSIFSMKKAGDMSIPLKGKNGVYVVVLQSITEAPALTDATANKINLTAGLRSRAQNDAYAAMRELAKIADNRGIN